MLRELIALLADRRSDRKELENHRKLVWRYCKLNDQDSALQIVDWDETFVINERGDAHEQIRILLRPLRPDLWFIRLLAGCGWPQPARFRSRVQVSARQALLGGAAGTSLLKTTAWRVDGKMDMTVHFNEPPTQGKALGIEINIAWPGRCAPLVKGSPERFSLGFTHSVRHARYEIVTPPGVTNYCELIPVKGHDVRYQLTTTIDGEEREHITFEAFDLPPRRTVGIWLETKEKSRRAMSLNGTVHT